MSQSVIFFIPLAGIVGMIFVGIFAWWVIKQDPGTPRMQEIASFIQQGANAFLRREFQTIAYFIIVIAVLLVILLGWQIAFGFVTGAVFSLLAIFIGMNAADRTYTYPSRKTGEARTVRALGTWPLLYDLKRDPGENYNVIRHHPEIERKLHTTLVDFEESFYANPRGWIAD